MNELPPLRAEYSLTVSKDEIAQHPEAMDRHKEELVRQAEGELLVRILNTPRHVNAQLFTEPGRYPYTVELRLNIYATSDKQNAEEIAALQSEIVRLKREYDSLMKEHIAATDALNWENRELVLMLAKKEPKNES